MSEEIVGALIGLGGALVGLAGGAAVTWRTHLSSEMRETASGFRDVLDKLITVRIETSRMLQELQAPQDLPTREAIGSALTARRLLLKATAAQALKNISSGITISDYLMLAYEHQIDSDFQQARTYYEQALSVVGGDDMATITVRRSLGGLYLAPTEFRDPDKAECHFEAALSLSRERTDAYSVYTTGYTLEVWGFALQHANGQGGEALLQRAEVKYRSMPSANPLRQQALDGLDHRRALVRSGRQPTPPPTDVDGVPRRAGAVSSQSSDAQPPIAGAQHEDASVERSGDRFIGAETARATTAEDREMVRTDRVWSQRLLEATQRTRGAVRRVVRHAWQLASRSER